MEHQKPDRVVYHAKMEALYNTVAAAIFKEQYFPADPFDGVLIDAAFLEIAELVNIFKAAKALEDEANGAFVQNLIHRGKHKTPMVRVNLLWLDALHQQKGKICEYLQKAYFEFDSVEEVVFYEQEIAEMNDSQLAEYLRQAQEALAIEVEMEK